MNYRPYRVVWELTNACNAKCIHCGSKSGKERQNELTEAEALRVCDELKELETKHVTLIGGEFFLKPYWEKVAQRLLDHGIQVGPLTNGIMLKDPLIAKLKNMGLTSIYISIDGIGETHDYTRGVPGLFNHITETIKKVKQDGFRVGVNTSVSSLNFEQIPALYEHLKSLGVDIWQVQLVENIGNANEHSEVQWSPEEVYNLVKYIAKIRKEKVMDIHLGDNIGFYVSFEPMLRDKPFTGCAGGRWALGIAADGGVRGCLSVEYAPETTEGNLRERSLKEIWFDEKAFSVYRQRTVEQLEGFCAECEYNNLCRAGCSSLAYSLTGSFYENPLCLHKYEKEMQAKLAGEVAPTAE